MIDFEKLKYALDNLSDEDTEKYFPKDTTPKGWIDIEVKLPVMYAIDIFSGGTEYKVKYSDGTEGVSMVSDHNVWHVLAKIDGITHWFNE